MAEFAIYRRSEVKALFFLGFASGIPFLLLVSTLHFRLLELGASLELLGYATLVTLPYSFKFIWASFLDVWQIPFLKKLGQRRSWLFASQGSLAIFIMILGCISLPEHPYFAGIIGLLIAFSSANQDLLIDIYRVESTQGEFRHAAAVMNVLGYRIGMLASGGGALYISHYWHWSYVHGLMALCVGTGMLTVLCIKEPPPEYLKSRALLFCKKEGVRLAGLAQLKNLVATPLIFILKKAYTWKILAFITCFKIADSFLNLMTNPFFYDQGFNKQEIALATLLFGLIFMGTGSLLAGHCLRRWGVTVCLALGILAQIAACLAFAVQSMIGGEQWLFHLVMAIKNTVSGMCATGLLAYFSERTGVEYRSTQLAILSSYSSLARTLLSVAAGGLAVSLEWTQFFLLAGVLASSAWFLLYWVEGRRANFSTQVWDPVTSERLIRAQPLYIQTQAKGRR